MTESAARPDYMTVKELAALLRVTERKVYDLVASGQVPCSKATGKLLFPEGEVRAWIEASKTGPVSGAKMGVQRPPVILGSHDPLLDWAIRHSGAGLATIFDASLDGLRRFQSGEGIAAGLHIREAEDVWNVGTVSEAVSQNNAVLVRWVRRVRGFVVRAEHGGTVKDVSGIAGLRVAVRQEEAGSEVLLRQVLGAAGLSSKELKSVGPFRSEQEAMLAVIQNEADVAFGLQCLSDPFGLHFLPVVNELYDLLVDRKAWFDAPLQSLFDFTASRTFKDHASRLAGVDVSDVGKVIWNA